MTGKQRAFLRSVSNNLDANFQIGKNGITENVVSQLDEILEVREIVKINVLKTSETSPKDVATEVSLSTNSYVVSVVGRKIVLYRQSEKLLLEGNAMKLPR